MRLCGLFLIAALQGAPPETPAKPLSVLVLGVEGRGGVEGETLEQTRVLIAQSLASHPGHKVITVEDVQELAKLAHDRELLGSEGADMGKLTDAARGVDADVVVTGSLARLGSSLVLTLQRIDVRTSGVDARNVTLARTKEIPGAVERLVVELMGISGAGARKPQYRLPDGKKVSFAVMDLTASGVKSDVVQNLTQVLSSEIKKVENTSVVSRADIQAMMQMEETRALAGCDQESCLAEIGGALGVEKLVAGSVGKLGDSYVVSLRLINVQDVSVESRTTESFTGAEDQLLHAIRQAARNLLGLEATGKGALTITASQPGALVTVDGKPQGAVPFPPVAELAAGAHTVEIEKSGYATWVGDAYIHPGETTAVWVNLQPLPPKFYQRPIFWLAVLAGGGVAVGIPVLVASVVVGATVIALRLITAPDPAARGTVTVQGY